MKTTHSKSKSFAWVLSASLLVSLGCSKPVFESGELANRVQSNPTPDAPTPDSSQDSSGGVPAPAPGTAEKVSFLQNEGSNKVDILIVNDNSFSMYTEQMKMAAKFTDFVSSLTDIDAHIGMTTTDPEVSQDKEFGQLLTWEGSESQILTPKTPNASAIFERSIARQETLRCSGSFGCGTTDEQPLLNVIQAIQGADRLHPGFLRPGADLSVVVLSDEDELSDGPARATKPAAVISTFKSIFGDSKNLVIHGLIVRPGDQACLRLQRDQAGVDAASSYGTHVAEAARLTGGTIGDICADDYSSQLREISRATRRLVTVFTLPSTPLDGSVKVTLTPYDDITFTVSGTQITFSKPPAPGTKIEIEYRR